MKRLTKMGVKSIIAWSIALLFAIFWLVITFT
ncbi:MAG: carbohydrate ABC transporter permease, partial [Clostridiales bacterium]|nr:carbohydrate ABC transporter permease [Clostridiales bacterium]